MPFVAKNAETNERLDITYIKNPKLELPRGKYVCQLCGQPLIVRSAHLRLNGRVRAHFAHTGDCEGNFIGHPESDEHRTAKLELRRHLSELYSPSPLKFELEYPIPMEWRDKGRVADLLVEWPSGICEVHEIQLAAITVDELKERTDDYNRAGYDVVWWIGGSADKVFIRDYLLESSGYCHLLQIQKYINTVSA